jgi:hypothetical protein
VSGFKKASGGMRDPAPSSFRVEITVCCTRGHRLLPFSRSTLPDRENEGVVYDRSRLGRGATLTGTGPQWRQIRLRCGQCPGNRGDVRVSREKLEARLAAMWAPYAKRRERFIWDPPEPPD